MKIEAATSTILKLTVDSGATKYVPFQVYGLLVEQGDFEFIGELKNAKTNIT